MSRIKAFTIIEIVVSLAISTIVILIAIMVYLMLSNQFSRYQNLNQKINTTYQLDFLIRQDIEESDSIVLVGESELLFYKDKQVILYDFYEDFVVFQKSSLSDTFWIKASFILEEDSYNKYLHMQYNISETSKIWSRSFSKTTSSFKIIH